MLPSVELLAWCNGQWRKQSTVGISLLDLGFLQGVTAVDRLRTVHGSPLDVEEHLSRFSTTCRQLGIELTAEQGNGELRHVIDQCARQNIDALRGSDFSIVVLATPGAASAPPQPTVIVHASRIPWDILVDWYRHGQPLFTADVCNVPQVCWSPQLKVRSRLQYYLAELPASRTETHGAGVLPDLSGNLTETAAANLVLIEGRRLVCAPAGSVLDGISLARTLRLARRCGIEIEHAPLEPQRCRSADGILLTGTTGCLWAAASLDDHRFAQPTQQPVYRELTAHWQAEIGLDYIAQATDAAAS